MSFGVTQPILFRYFNTAHLICELDTKEKVVYLTFDDGPIPVVTPEILRILKERNCKATFFCVGENTRKYPEILKQILLEGHSVGNHSFHHLNGWKSPTKDYIKDVHRCNDYFSTRLFRPPYGKFTLSQYYQLRKEYKFILWSVLTGDYNSRVSPGKCLKNAIVHSRPGSIIVFHDNLKSKENVLFALPRYLDHYFRLGYRFEGIGTMRKEVTRDV